MNRMVWSMVLLPMVVGSLSLSAAEDDWPMYRGDVGRSGYTSASLPGQLQLRWVNTSFTTPTPAWPGPARGSFWQNLDKIEARITDDVAYHPVIADGKLLFGSSTDDTVYAVDLQSGETVWSFTTDGPVRYAPAVAGERVFFGSDDGQVYCVSLAKGALQWSKGIGPARDLIPGNERVISPFPIRTGVLVDDDVVYACAGLFPSQGVYAAALKAETGEDVWRQQLPSQSPQGYLLATKTQLFVPTGRGAPFSIYKAGGKVGKQYPSFGGTYAVVAGDDLIAGRGYDNRMQSSLVTYKGEHIVVTGRFSYLLSGGMLTQLDRPRHVELTRQKRAADARLRHLNKTKAAKEEIAEATATVKELNAGIAACFKWKRPVGAASSLIVAGDTVVIGGKDGVLGIDTTEGKPRWELQIAGEAIGLAAGDGRLIVTTKAGQVYCFAGVEGADERKRGDAPVHIARQERGDAPDTAAAREAANKIKTAMTALPCLKGYAIIFGADSRDAINALVEQSELRLVVVDKDAKKVAAIREQLLRHGLYGTRISAHAFDGERLPLTGGFANLVVVADKALWPDEEAKRLAAPFHGIALLSDGELFIRGPIDGGGQWTHMYADLANTANGNDQRIGNKLALQWFGGPGPKRMIDRHLRGPPPLSVGGRLFILGENMIIGCDAYNGTELWQIDLPDSQRYSAPYDCGYISARADRLFAGVRKECWVIDTATGQRERTIRLPGELGETDSQWGFVGVDGEVLYGSAMHPNAARQTPSRQQIDIDYKSNQPLVTSHTFFKMNVATGKADWKYSEGAILHPTITVGGGRVYFVESRNEQCVNHPTGRIDLKTLLASDAYLVALDAATGKRLWQRPLAPDSSGNVTYLVYTDEKLILQGSTIGKNKDSVYHLNLYTADGGEPLWNARHDNLKPGALGHGEQVHHPVVLGDRLVAEPFIYDLKTGEKVNPNVGQTDPWAIRRPGHSCGTMSGTGNTVFFRANNPTMLDLSESSSASDRFTRLAPSRPGCWINIIPSGGLLLIPESSASCICKYSLQTSMAFRPAP